MKRPSIRIVLIDDHELVRKGLRALLSCERDLAIVGEAGTVADAVCLVERLRPHVALLDMKMPDAPGPEACRRLLAVAPQIRILVLTSYAEDAAVVAAIQNGAHGYALKDAHTGDLMRAVRAVAQGRGYLDPRVARQALHWIQAHPQSEMTSQGIAQLSPQERLIMPLLADGKTNKEIAAQLRVSDKTVKNSIAHIFDKLHVKRRTEAVAWFVKEHPSGYTMRDT